MLMLFKTLLFLLLLVNNCYFSFVIDVAPKSIGVATNVTNQWLNLFGSPLVGLSWSYDVAS
jgi:hypothetical protein